jgi:ribosomal protein S4
LDVILYRARFATSYLQLHQWIAHGKVCVNGQVVTTKGRLLSPGDVVSIHPQAVSSVEESMRTFWAHAPLSQPTPTTFCPRRKLVRREAFVRDQSGRLVKTLLHASTLKTKKNKVSSLWWKPTHLEINYQTLHLVVLWHPQTLVLPTILKSTHLKAAVAR